MAVDLHPPRLRSAIAAACMIAATLSAAWSSETRVDLFDRTDNRLMFVTISTDAAGNRTGDSVFMADSTFVRATTVQSSTREFSLNFNGDTSSVTTLAGSGTARTFSVVDQFGLAQLGGTVSVTGDGTDFTISQAGSAINKMRYSSGGSGDLRIDVSDNAGNLLYYASTNASAVVPGPARATPDRSSFCMVGQGSCRITVRLDRSARVRAELFLPSGRQAAVLVDETMKAGAHTVLARTPRNLANGLYLLRLSINGQRVAGHPGPVQALGKQTATPGPSEVVPPSLIFELLALNGDLETAQRPKYRSPAAVVASPDKGKIYVAEQTAKRVAVINVASNTLAAEYLLPNEPTGIAVSPDGIALYVTCASERWPAGMVCVVNSSTGTVTRRIPVGHSARCPVLTPDGRTLYVCNWLESTVSEVDLAAGRETNRIPVVREPYSAVITEDGNYLIVGNSLPDEKATDTAIIASKITFISTSTHQVVKTLRLPAGSHSLFGMCISNDGRYAFATHLIGRMTIPAITLTQGWVHSNNLAIIDIDNQKLLNDVELDDATRGAANPWGVACTGDDKFVCVAHAGSNQLTFIDLPQLITKASGPDTLSHAFAALAGIKKQFDVPGRGPRALTVIGTTAYVAPYFGDAIYRYSVSLSTSAPIDSVPLGSAKAMTAERKGEFLYADASLCFQKWQSCFSCHPFTRPDALNWILSQSAYNAPKNVKSHLYSFQTPPTNWAGRRPDAFQSVEYGIRLEQQIEPTPDMTQPLDTFLMRLKPVPSPYLDKGRLSASGSSGRAIYAGTKVDCRYCHPAPLFTDNKFWNSGVQDPFDPTTAWNTPSLVEAWRTAPYDHIGSTASMGEMLRLPGHSTNVARLTTQEFADLLEYVNSL